MRVPTIACLAVGLLAACKPAPQADSAPAAPARQATAGPRLELPIACEPGVSCEIQNYVDRDPGPGVKDYRCRARTYEGHDGVDIRVPDMAAEQRGVAVLAAAAGRVSRLRDGVADVSVKAPGAASVAGQECGNGVVVDHGGGWETQYCHLAQSSLKVKVGDVVRAGQPIARVGLSGNTEYPHLHISVRHAGKAVDPFAPDPAAPGCAAEGSLWTPGAQRALAYKAGAVLNAGFAGGPVTLAMVEDVAAPPAGAQADALVAYVRAIGLEGGDVQQMVLTGPGDAVLATSSLPPLDRAKAQTLMFIGKKRPAEGWPAGTYRAIYTVRRDGGAAVQRSFELGL